MEAEKNILIAERVIGKGDTWKLLGGEEIHPSLTDTLNDYYIKSTVKPIAYRLEPMNNKLYAIVESISLMREPKKFDLYGEH